MVSTRNRKLKSRTPPPKKSSAKKAPQESRSLLLQRRRRQPSAPRPLKQQRRRLRQRRRRQKNLNLQHQRRRRQPNVPKRQRNVQSPQLKGKVSSQKGEVSSKACKITGQKGKIDHETRQFACQESRPESICCTKGRLKHLVLCRFQQSKYGRWQLFLLGSVCSLVIPDSFGTTINSLFLDPRCRHRWQGYIYRFLHQLGLLATLACPVQGHKT